MDVYQKSRILTEKYNLVNRRAGGGGEYAVQAGFDWADGVPAFFENSENVAAQDVDFNAIDANHPARGATRDPVRERTWTRRQPTGQRQAGFSLAAFRNDYSSDGYGRLAKRKQCCSAV